MIKSSVLGVLAALGAGAVAGPALGAGTVHTMVLTTAPLSVVNSGPEQISTEKLFHGRQLYGEGVGYCVAKGSGATCTAAYALSGGLIYARVTATATSGRGVITGGTGTFARARGTLTIVHLSRTRLRLTFTYRG